MSKQKRRRSVLVAIALVVICSAIYLSTDNYTAAPVKPAEKTATVGMTPAIQALEKLTVKGRAPKTGYTREQFGDGWRSENGCDTRNIILARDMHDVKTNDKCQVISGVLDDPYTGKTINFKRGPTTSAAVQIDHVVALSDAWQTGAQQLSFEVRVKLANDPLELLAVDGPANQQKSDGDAATWLPSNKAFRCQYVARQIAVKTKYHLYVTAPEKAAIRDILARCPSQKIPS